MTGDAPKLRLLANRVLVRVHTQPGEGTSDVVALLAVDREGHVDVVDSSMEPERTLSRIATPNREVRATAQDARDMADAAAEAIAAIDARRNDSIAALEEAGIIELREVGPEDSEWFLTREARKLVSLTDLGEGWKRWPI